tara:strand:- start:759 stop:881 length:123 start_codon:yes stop_codon:yes gene_type:complete
MTTGRDQKIPGSWFKTQTTTVLHFSGGRGKSEQWNWTGWK